jgi:hypothetical protein
MSLEELDASEYPIAYWRGLYWTTSQMFRKELAGLASQRERSDFLLRKLCEQAQWLTRYSGVFWRRYHRNPTKHRSEVNTFIAMAAVNIDEFIQAVHERFPDDDYPVERLDPFLIEEGRVQPYPPSSQSSQSP